MLFLRRTPIHRTLYKLMIWAVAESGAASGHVSSLI